ncbi:MAG: hypothetical protein O2943_05965 [Actinomycetota bacterium]|nr:hypothetical protein [Actinomycetota bacterium]
MPWLLDQGPPDLRTGVLRTLPLALVRYLCHYMDSCLAATRTAYGQARVELGPLLTPAELVSAQQSIQAQGARFLQLQRELVLVEAALTKSIPASAQPING